jgi:hypothetical protein
MFSRTARQSAGRGAASPLLNPVEHTLATFLAAHVADPRSKTLEVEARLCRYAVDGARAPIPVQSAVFLPEKISQQYYAPDVSEAAFRRVVSGLTAATAPRHIAKSESLVIRHQGPRLEFARRWADAADEEWVYQRTTKKVAVASEALFVPESAADVRFVIRDERVVGGAAIPPSIEKAKVVRRRRTTIQLSTSCRLDATVEYSWPTQPLALRPGDGAAFIFSTARLHGPRARPGPIALPQLRQAFHLEVEIDVGDVVARRGLPGDGRPWHVAAAAEWAAAVDRVQCHCR